VADFIALAVYVGRGWRLSGVGIEGLWDLARVPGFLFWKLFIVRFQPKPSTWVRTKRER
jgi:1,2-diacylglycerol 3-beta-glucosyltransferase